MKRDLISIKDLSKEDILDLIGQAEELKRSPPGRILEGKILASCFFEPSTRTRLSFEAAMARLGGTSIGFSSGEMTSTRKGESIQDTMRMMGSYADIIVIRHPLDGSAQAAADAVDIPVVNGGDGANQHPTQTLLDLFSIKECQGKLDGLRVGLAGDLRYGRTVHSLAQALVHFDVRLYLIAPETLEMPQDICDFLRQKGVRFSFHHTLEEVLPKLDILYMTRIQKERFTHAVDSPLRLTPEMLESAPTGLRVLHPLPRLEEIDPRVDTTEHAYYFQQAADGLPVRQALLANLLGALQPC